MPYLELLGGAGGRFEVRADAPFAIGSSRRAQLRLEGPGVSFTHAVIECTPAGFTLVAKPSAGGTWVNGEPVDRRAPRLLAPGDVLRFGEVVEARFVSEELGPSRNAPGASPAEPRLGGNSSSSPDASAVAGVIPHPIGAPAPDPASASRPGELAAAADGLPPAAALAYLREEVVRLAEALERAQVERDARGALLAAAEEERDALAARVVALEGQLAREAAANEALRDELKALAR